MMPEDPSRLCDTRETASAGDAGNGNGGPVSFLGFVGSYTHGIDAKGRMIIPASFREPLGSRFAVAPTPEALLEHMMKG